MDIKESKVEDDILYGMSTRSKELKNKNRPHTKEDGCLLLRIRMCQNIICSRWFWKEVEELNLQLLIKQTVVLEANVIH